MKTMKELVHEMNAEYFEYLINLICIPHDEVPYTDSEIGRRTRQILQEYLIDIQEISKKGELTWATE